MCANVQIAHSIEEIVDLALALPEGWRLVLLSKLQERFEREQNNKQSSIDVFS